MIRGRKREPVGTVEAKEGTEGAFPTVAARSRTLWEPVPAGTPVDVDGRLEVSGRMVPLELEGVIRVVCDRESSDKEGWPPVSEVP